MPIILGGHHSILILIQSSHDQMDDHSTVIVWMSMNNPEFHQFNSIMFPVRVLHYIDLYSNNKQFFAIKQMIEMIIRSEEMTMMTLS